MENENKSAEQIIAEKKSADDELTAKNDEAYTSKNIKSVDEEVVKIRIEKGVKEKVIERVTYRNGVVKNRLVGLLVNGVVKYGRAPKKKK